MPQRKAPVAKESDLSYTNKLTGKHRRFSPKPTEVVATFQPVHDLRATAEALQRLPLTPRVTDPLHNFAIYQVQDGNDAQSVSNTIINQPGVANAMPAMIDDEGLVRYFLPDEIAVRFRSGVSDSHALDSIRGMGSEVLSRQRTPGYFTIAVPGGKGLFATIRLLIQLSEVMFAEPTEIGLDDIAIDVTKQWALRNLGQVVNNTSGRPEADINVMDAWRVSKGGPGVVVVVIDTGVRTDHPNLRPNLLPQMGEDWNFSESEGTAVEDSNGHGTHVAGIAAGADIGSGMIGVAPLCRIMPLRVDLSAGKYQSRADAINYVTAMAAGDEKRHFVINCSWRMGGDNAGVHSAIMDAVNNGVLVVAAAGNANLDTTVSPFYPAAYNEVLAVGATDQSDKKASLSNFGALVDVFAPGVNIYSTYVDEPYAFLDGTSQASPHVAGLAGLIWSANPTLTVGEVRGLIEQSCVDIGPYNSDYVGKLGKGRIDAGRALAASLRR